MSEFRLGFVWNAVLFAALGLLVFGAALAGLNRFTHFWTRIAEEKNLPLAVLIGALAIGIAIIVAAAVH